ncbi:MAG TPA: aldehyde dehydrogenase, partial [Clostridiales bacterium]|nr:aldehyde dehydrogenase [Clostridiales bacterium]
CRAIAWEVYKDENIARLAALAVEETGMGVAADKLTKHKVKVMGVLQDVLQAKSVGLIERIPEKQIWKYAKPVGVVGALTPVTNPTATPASNTISILKGRNAVIFAPHPRSKKSSGLAADYLRQGLPKVGAPEDLVQIIAEPSIELTNELMRQVDLVVATGGGPMVHAAYSSGTPAYGVGPGNSVQMVAEDADIADAATKITLSKAFDNATSCSSENSVVIHESICSRMIAAFGGQGGYLCSQAEKARLQAWMWVPDKKGQIGLNPKIIAQSAAKIAEDAGLKIPAGTRILLVEGSRPLEEDPFSSEKISPVLTLWKYGSFPEGYDILKRLTDHCGRGHSCGIHTYNREYIEYLAEHMQTSRIMVRQPQAPANGGNFFNGMPSTVTLGCGTWGGNITTENINFRHFLNITWVSEPFPPVKPTEEALWGDFWARYGK